MEKSSEKLIRETSPLKSRFRDMLSQVQIKLPSNIETKQKPRNLVLEIESYFDRNGSNVLGEELNSKTLDKKSQSNPNVKEKQNHFVLNVPLRTKNSSLNKQHTILERLRCLINDRGLFGKHWENNLSLYQYELLEHAFNCIKNYPASQNYTFHKISSVQQNQKANKLAKILKRMEDIRVRSGFQRLIQLYRDSILFGLSNTVGDIKDNSLLKLQSQCGYLGLQTVKQLKKDVKTEKQLTQINMSKKASSSCGSESLSALILNHNKLNISPEANLLYPNIPKSNKNLSNKLIASNKDIGQLSLQTKKKIQSSRKLVDNKDLPLESRKNLNDKNNRQTQNQSIVNNQEEKGANRPITFTYILKDLDFNGLLPNTESKESASSKKNIDEEIRKWNATNGIPVTESHYQQPIRNVFMQNNKPQPQKRSTSLQIKHLPGLFISPQKPHNQVNPNRVSNNQYYNQENCNRENLIRPVIQFRNPTQAKPRAKSAAPKVTFNFCSSNQPPLLQKSSDKKKNQQVRKVGYQQADCIIQKSLLHDKNTHVTEVNRREDQVKTIRLQVVSPSNRRDSNMMHKLKTQQRQSIKQRLLPPVLNDYYFNQQTHSHTHQNRIKVPILSNSNTSTQPTHTQQQQNKKGNLKQYKKGVVHQLYFGEIEQQEAGCHPTLCQKSQPNGPRVKCHKERILVTYSSKDRI